jgi:hypothetical protein
MGRRSGFRGERFCIHLSHQQSRDKGWLNFCNRRFFPYLSSLLLAIVTFFFCGGLLFQSLFFEIGATEHTWLQSTILTQRTSWHQSAFWSITVNNFTLFIHYFSLSLGRKLVEQTVGRSRR